MEKHKKAFGLAYDDIMIFPNGRFSIESMRIIQEQGFSAVVNTRLLATNYRGGVTLCDLIKPATAYYGPPLFLRRYPHRNEDYAFDLFLGRPALIVQHNLDFSDDWKSIIGLIRQLKKMDSNLKWMPLGKLVSNYCQLQPQPSDSIRSINLSYTPKSYLLTLTRRLLCNLRDNTIHKHKMFRKIFKLASARSVD
jgi:hypothetical protein